MEIPYLNNPTVRLPAAVSWHRYSNVHGLAMGVLVIAAYMLMSCQTPMTIGDQARVFRPEQFGAIGDGVHDDSRYIQHCIDLAAQLTADETGRKGTVILDGTYYVTRQVLVVDGTTSENELEIGPSGRIFHVPSGVMIAGHGTLTLLHDGKSSKTQPANYTYVFWIAHDPQKYSRSRRNTADPTESRVRHVTIADITIVNDPASLMYAPWSETAAIWIYDGADITIDNVKMRHFHRGVAMAHCMRSRVTRCTIEDTRYIGIANYNHAGGSRRDRNYIESNRIIGNTHLSGGIYSSGRWTDVRNNRLTFSRGIWLLAYQEAVVEGNHIRRSPIPIRLGYGVNEGARNATIRNNVMTGCASGITLNGAVDCTVVGNRMEKFIEHGADPMIEPPRGGYWGYGRVRAGIHAEDCQNVRIVDNVINGMNSGCPVGIHVSNSRFSTDYSVDPYKPTHKNDPPGIVTNSENIVQGNRIQAKSGLRIGYYIENQQAISFNNNSATGEVSNRIIHCTGPVGTNRLSSELKIVKDATPQCRRLVLRHHPMHPLGDPHSKFKYVSPVPENEYFPPPPEQIPTLLPAKTVLEEMGPAYPY